MSRKSERLVNLTIALLASKRWITKTQIFSSVDGYEGDADSMERMFERDKDDLRKLGISIEVGSFDPLFEDEVGYRIKPDSYKIDIEPLAPRELSLISLATQAWHGAILDSSALSALVKLKSLGINSDLDSLPAIVPIARISDTNFATVIDAIAERRVISFRYLNNDLASDDRVIEPYGAGSKTGYWYVAGFDLNRKDVRVFRFDRFDSEVKVQGAAGAYEVPSSFRMRDLLSTPESSSIAIVRVRREKAHALRNRALAIEDGEEWSTIELPYIHEADLVSEVLWHGADAVLLQPASARKVITDALTEIVKSHG